MESPGAQDAGVSLFSPSPSHDFDHTLLPQASHERDWLIQRCSEPHTCRPAHPLHIHLQQTLLISGASGQTREQSLSVSVPERKAHQVPSQTCF